MFEKYKGAFVINLKDDFIRKDEFLKKWNNDSKLEFIEAVDSRGDLWCWEECLKNKDGDYCLILEDDSIIPEDIFSKIDEIVNEVKIKWGIINLGWVSTTPYQILNNNLVIVDRFFLTHAYLLSNHGAETLLRLHKKIEKQVDAFMSDHSKEIIILGLMKNLFFQNSKIKTHVQTIDAGNINFKNQNDYIINYHR